MVKALLCFMPAVIMKIPRYHRSKVRRRLAIIIIVESNQPDMRQNVRMQKKNMSTNKAKICLKNSPRLHHRVSKFHFFSQGSCRTPLLLLCDFITRIQSWIKQNHSDDSNKSLIAMHVSLKVVKDPDLLQGDGEGSDQTGLLPRLI